VSRPEPRAPQAPSRRRADQRSAGTRELILDAAERLFAERGVTAVSNRQVVEAAGQANTSAVGYHFGTKSDLVLAVLHRHLAGMEARRAAMVARLTPASGLRACMACFVLPFTEHLAAQRSPTWYARFALQVMADPFWRLIVLDDVTSAPALRQAVAELGRRLPALPPEVRLERAEMIRHLIMCVCADRERALQEGTGSPRADWQDTATGLLDAVTGLCVAPVTGA
jgi:AcrR family transcriptional regulator